MANWRFVGAISAQHLIGRMLPSIAAGLAVAIVFSAPVNAGEASPMVLVTQHRFLHIDGGVNANGTSMVDEQAVTATGFMQFQDDIDFEINHGTGTASSYADQHSSAEPHLLSAYGLTDSRVLIVDSEDSAVANARSKYEVTFSTTQTHRWRLVGFAQDEGLATSFVRLQQGLFNYLAAVDGDAGGQQIDVILELPPGQYTVHAEAMSNVFTFDASERTGRAEIWLRFGPTTATLIGDMNCDGAVSISDIGAFVLALTNPDGYAGQFPACSIDNGDGNGDGEVTVSDIGRFVDLVTTD